MNWKLYKIFTFIGQVKKKEIKMVSTERRIFCGRYTNVNLGKYVRTLLLKTMQLEDFCWYCNSKLIVVVEIVQR